MKPAARGAWERNASISRNLPSYIRLERSFIRILSFIDSPDPYRRIAIPITYSYEARTLWLLEQRVLPHPIHIHLCDRHTAPSTPLQQYICHKIKEVHPSQHPIYNFKESSPNIHVYEALLQAPFEQIVICVPPLYKTSPVCMNLDPTRPA
jgi:hypothetical protein